MSVYQVENSFNRLKMGSNPYDIYMCTPMDVMHGLQHGIIKYVLGGMRRRNKFMHLFCIIVTMLSKQFALCLFVSTKTTTKHLR